MEAKHEHHQHQHSAEDMPNEHEHDHSAQNPAHGEHGHDHHKMMIEDFKRRFWVSLALTIPVLLLSPMIQDWIGVNWGFTFDRYLLFILSSL
ncbi:MAG: heavy metal translocating P-type ATPase, partial [Cytophagales bacterium]|nr:heavy metal translocating P-type ATPase [Cytophagales bacterium]